MTEISQRTIVSNGISMRLHEAGADGARGVVVLLHGFPELGYSYRHQLVALAEAGYHAIAPDMRGYGGTDRPADYRSYTTLHLVGDVVGILDAVEAPTAVVVGHDWGAPVAWNTALMRPDRIRGVVGLSVPYFPRGPVSALQGMRAALGDGFYMQYFQEPGVAEAELEGDVRHSVRSILYGLSGQATTGEGMAVVPDGGGILDVWKAPDDGLPDWLTDADVDHYTAEFERTGYACGLNYYRVVDLSWELTAPWAGASVSVPALYVVGDRDIVYHFPGVKDMVPALSAFVPDLRDTVVVEGSGHWIQQERPEVVNTALLDFLDAL